MSKVAALRAMREAKHTKAKKPTLGERVIESLKQAVEFAEGKREAKTTIVMVPADAAKLLGSKGGKSKSPAKQAASKENGKKGGRPKRLGSE